MEGTRPTSAARAKLVGTWRSVASVGGGVRVAFASRREARSLRGPKGLAAPLESPLRGSGQTAAVACPPLWNPRFAGRSLEYRWHVVVLATPASPTRLGLSLSRGPFGSRFAA